MLGALSMYGFTPENQKRFDDVKAAFDDRDYDHMSSIIAELIQNR